MTVKNKWIKRIFAGALAGTLVFSLAACGGKGDVPGSNNGGQNGGGQTQGAPEDGGYVWVPKYYTMSQGTEEDAWYGNFSFAGNSLYYTINTYGEESKERMVKLDLSNPGAPAEELMDMGQFNGVNEEETMQAYPYCMTVCEDGSILMVLRITPILSEDATEADWERREREMAFHVKKLAADGTEVFDVDITEVLRSNETVYPQDILAVSDGSFYVHDGSNYVWVFDKEGNHVTTVSLSAGGQFGYVQALGLLPDGRVAILQNSSGGMMLQVYNADTKQFSDSFDNLPKDCYNSDIGVGPNGGVLLKDGRVLYEYDLEKKEYTELLNWVNCDINPDYVQTYAALPDGRIGVCTSDWGTSEKTLILLERTPAAEVVQKETLTLGCMSISQSLQSAVVNFNKNSDKYRIEIKEYAASLDWSVENAYEDARTQFFNDILTGNAPDMFMAGDIDLKMFAQKGLIEDLAPYLESSTVIKRGDFFASILDAYTVGGALCAIPRSFQVMTLMGRASELGEKSGWTMEEMMAYADQYPDAEIFPYTSKENALSTCLAFDFDSYVNWETGECYFDTPEFKLVLEFAARFPSQSELNYDGPSEPVKLINHTALLSEVSFSDPQQWQVSERMFNEPVTAVGYPSSHSNGVLATGQDAVCISAYSANKEAAWAFIASLLVEESQSNGMFMWGYPVNKAVYDREMKEAMEPDYMLDENGEPMLDENGEPIEVSHSSYGWGNDFEIEIYSVKQREADATLELINSVSGIYYYDSNLMNIITEETAPYFAGQKSVDEVADIIQSRVRIYINESR